MATVPWNKPQVPNLFFPGNMVCHLANPVWLILFLLQACSSGISYPVLTLLSISPSANWADKVCGFTARRPGPLWTVAVMVAGPPRHIKGCFSRSFPPVICPSLPIEPLKQVDRDYSLSVVCLHVWFAPEINVAWLGKLKQSREKKGN